ncbi:MAG: hypothetical protein ACWGQW_25370 [bacterium]
MGNLKGNYGKTVEPGRFIMSVEADILIDIINEWRKFDAAVRAKKESTAFSQHWVVSALIQHLEMLVNKAMSEPGGVDD